MSFKKNFTLFTLLMISVFSVFASSYDLVQPSKKERHGDDFCGVIIDTNIEGASLYINGTYVGKTKYVTTDLDSRYYNIEIRLSGYDTIYARIHPQEKYTYTYNFRLIKTCGFIEFNNLPNGARASVDGATVYSNRAEVDPGYHSVRVRLFGYEDYNVNVNVENHKTVYVDVNFVPAAFEISNFKISKSKINPDYSSGIGKTNISFYVTCDSSAILSASDRYGNVVWSYDFPSFSTWEQGVTWDGTDSEGYALPDGTYTINLYSFDYSFSGTVTIDRSMVYPLTTYTPSGSGIGNLVCAFDSETSFVKPFVSFGPMLTLDDEKSDLYAVPIDFGILFDFAKHFELGFSCGFGVGYSKDETPFNFNSNFKGTGNIKLSSDVSLSLAGTLRYGFTNHCNFTPEGFDLGNGLGLGLAAGITGDKLYLGVTGEYIFGGTIQKEDKADPNKKNILKYGVVGSIFAQNNIRINAWGAVHNYENFEFGAELITMPAASSFCFDAKVYSLLDKNNNMLLNAQIGLSYLF